MVDNASKLTIDKTLSALLPALSADELSGLERDILRDGCISPLIVWGDVLVDGHHRYAICQKHGIGFKVKAMEFSSVGEACLWAFEHGNHRRNITAFQKSEIAMRLEPEIKARSRQGQRTDLSPNSAKSEALDTREELARSARVSHDTFAKAKVLAASAPEPVKKKLREGSISINAAYKAVDKAKKKDAKAKAKGAVPSDLPRATDRYTIHEGKLSGVGDKVSDASVDWIITDPPYPKEYLPVYDDLGVFAARALKPGGSLVCMVGQSYLPDVIASLCKCLTYQWTLAYLTPGGQAVQQWDRKVNTFWKPLLWFVKGKYKGDWIGDVCQSKANDKDHHKWGQSESGMADIIERFTYPGQMICDPFLGAGTTGVVAVAAKRLFIGIDSDPKAISASLKRLSQVRDE